MKKLFAICMLSLAFTSCDMNDADGRNAKDTTNAATADTTRMMIDSTTSGMDTARESYNEK